MSKSVTVKNGTLVNATIIASAREGEDDARRVKHKGKPAVHGFKAHAGADADTALVEDVSVTSANINDGRAGPEALPDNPGEMFADSACRGNPFRDVVRAKGGIAGIVATGMWGRDEQETLRKLKEWNQPIHRARGRIEKMEALLRPAPNAMALHRQSRRPGPPHRHRHRHASIADRLRPLRSSSEDRHL